MEVCTTLGMLSPEQARALKDAGLTAYNHNLDSSREYYPEVSSVKTIIPSFINYKYLFKGHYHSYLRRSFKYYRQRS